MTSENIIVEIIGRNGEPAPGGEVGSIVITDLNNCAMPLIRYQIGDQASRLDDECPCGRALPLLGPIEGRIMDIIVTPDGRFDYYSGLGETLRETHVEQFQIHQHSRHELVVHAVISPEWREIERERIRQKIRAIVGGDMEIRVEFHEALEGLQSGKRRLVRSDIIPRGLT